MYDIYSCLVVDVHSLIINLSLVKRINSCTLSADDSFYNISRHLFPTCSRIFYKYLSSQWPPPLLNNSRT